jgi:hypothetical protein
MSRDRPKKENRSETERPSCGLLSCTRFSVSNYLAQLQLLLPCVPPVPVKALKALRAQRDYKGMIRLIKTAMNVEPDLRILWVPEGVATDESRRDAPAWVNLPAEMPTYGSAAFKELRLDICLRRSFLDQSTYDQIAIVIAHELSHIVLSSIKHPLRECEKAVDLTAMLLGFRRLYVSGCDRTLGNNELHLGYLDVREVMSAHNILAKLQKENLASRISIFLTRDDIQKALLVLAVLAALVGIFPLLEVLGFFP